MYNESWWYYPFNNNEHHFAFIIRRRWHCYNDVVREAFKQQHGEDVFAWVARSMAESDFDGPLFD